MAITHFAVGATLTAIVALYLLPPTRYARTLVLLGGVWAMLPDVHWVTPIFAAEINSFHSSVFANVFWFHETLDVLDPTDSRGIGALALGVFLLTVTLGDRWSYTTRERTDPENEIDSPLEPIRSLTLLTRLAGSLGLLLGGTYLATGLLHPGVGTLRGLYLGIGIALVATASIGVGGSVTVATWLIQHVSRPISLTAWSILSTGSAIIGGVLLVVPLRRGITAEAVAFAGLGALLLILTLLIAQLRVRH